LTHTIKFDGLPLFKFDIELFEAVLSDLLPNARLVILLGAADSAAVRTEVEDDAPAYTIVRYQIYFSGNVDAMVHDLEMVIANNSLVDALEAASPASILSDAAVVVESEDAMLNSVFRGVVTVTLLPPSSAVPATGYRRLNGMGYIVYNTRLSFDDVSWRLENLGQVGGSWGRGSICSLDSASCLWLGLVSFPTLGSRGLPPGRSRPRHN
jgi:hypothetical protein